MFGGKFQEYLDGPWDQVRGYLVEHLEQLDTALSTMFSRVLDLDGTLKPGAFEGDATSPSAGVVYISNEGVKGKPKWAKVNLSEGVKSRLKLVNFTLATANVILGHGSGSGNYEAIALGDALEISSSTINVKFDDATITLNDDGELQAAGAGGYVPLALGAEPLSFVSNGAGEPIFINYTP